MLYGGCAFLRGDFFIVDVVCMGWRAGSGYVTVVHKRRCLLVDPVDLPLTVVGVLYLLELFQELMGSTRKYIYIYIYDEEIEGNSMLKSVE